jgi:hypothetical protein
METKVEGLAKSLKEFCGLKGDPKDKLISDHIFKCFEMILLCVKTWEKETPGEQYKFAIKLRNFFLGTFYEMKEKKFFLEN